MSGVFFLLLLLLKGPEVRHDLRARANINRFGLGYKTVGKMCVIGKRSKKGKYSQVA